VNRTAAAFDVPRFSDWLGQVTGEPATVTVTQMSGGASCEMFRVERLGQSWVVRRAPVTSVSDTAHHVVREARVIEALAGSGVPVPTILAVGDDPDVLGAPFFVMSFIDGGVVRRNGLPEALAAHPESHHSVGEGLIDTLVSLHEVDWQSTPLAGLSHPEGFLARQVDRWLAANQPARGDLAVMHGDYKLDNVLWSRQPPPRVLSVVDFEMTTIGDPLIDLAWAMIFWPEEGNLIALAAPGSPNGIAAEQCQTPAQLVQRYTAATGRDLSGFDWYQAFSAWKLAIVLEASYAKFRSGESTNPHHEVFGFVVDELLSRAERFAR
jgi:aminoglycoside phosphotransferase (APT) family kinase protein